MTNTVAPDVKDATQAPVATPAIPVTSPNQGEYESIVQPGTMITANHAQDAKVD